VSARGIESETLKLLKSVCSNALSVRKVAQKDLKLRERLYLGMQLSLRLRAKLFV